MVSGQLEIMTQNERLRIGLVKSVLSTMTTMLPRQECRRSGGAASSRPTPLCGVPTSRNAMPLFASGHAFFHRAVARRGDKGAQRPAILKIPDAHLAIVTAARQAFRFCVDCQ